MWDRARTATAGLDRLHRPSRRHLKGPSADDQDIYPHSPVNALGIAIARPRPQRPQRPQRPEIAEIPQRLQRQAVDVASPAGMYVHPPKFQLELACLVDASCMGIKRHPILPCAALPPCSAASFALEHMPVDLEKGTASSRCASKQGKKEKNKAILHRAVFPHRGWLVA